VAGVFAVAAAIVALGGGWSGASAQVEKVGLLIGYNTAAMNMAFSKFGGELGGWTGRARFSSSFGYHAGASAEIPLSEIELRGLPYMLSIDPTALFVSKGGKYTGRITATRNGIEYPGYYTVSAYYAEILVPIAFKREFSSYNVKASVGPSISLGLFGQQKYTVPDYYNEKHTQSTFDPNEGLDRVDAGVFVSVSAEFGETITIGVRYGSGFWDESISSAAVTLGYNIRL
jgi:hypothetical protein